MTDLERARQALAIANGCQCWEVAIRLIVKARLAPTILEADRLIMEGENHEEGIR